VREKWWGGRGRKQNSTIYEKVASLKGCRSHLLKKRDVIRRSRAFQESLLKEILLKAKRKKSVPTLVKESNGDLRDPSIDEQFEEKNLTEEGCSPRTGRKGGYLHVPSSRR